jgi:hypothetical protein
MLTKANESQQVISITTIFGDCKKEYFVMNYFSVQAFAFGEKIQKTEKTIELR